MSLIKTRQSGGGLCGRWRSEQLLSCFFKPNLTELTFSFAPHPMSFVVFLFHSFCSFEVQSGKQQQPVCSFFSLELQKSGDNYICSVDLSKIIHSEKAAFLKTTYYYYILYCIILYYIKYGNSIY